MTTPTVTAGNTAPPTEHESPLHAHIRAVLHRLDDVKKFAVEGLRKLGVFVETEAPVVAAVAGAVASVVPGVGPAAAAVVTVAEKAAEVVAKVHPLAAVPPRARTR